MPTNHRRKWGRPIKNPLNRVEWDEKEIEEYIIGDDEDVKEKM